MTPRRLILLTLAFLLLWGASERRMVVARLASFFLETPALADVTDQGPEARWIDDYYTVEALDERTFAIGEPRYAQQNFNYLIVGSERAILFDAGPGVRDIRPIAASLTDKPITFIPSHFHFDHLGDNRHFENLAVINLPAIRERAPNGRLTLTSGEHLGFAEGFDIPTIEITEWLDPGKPISLGDRSLIVIHTPGHTTDSITLVEAATGFVFAGDFIYPGPLFAFLPTSGMGDYLDGANAILETVPAGSRILSAHRSAPTGIPELSLGDVEDLKTALEKIQSRELSGTGLYPRIYDVNETIGIWAEPRWLQRW